MLVAATPGDKGMDSFMDTTVWWPQAYW